IAAAETQRKIIEARLQKTIKDAASGDTDTVRMAEGDAQELAKQLTQYTVPAVPRLVVDDCTPERLATLLCLQGGRIGSLAPEGDIFDMMAGKYTANGTPNLGVYLRGHAGDPLRVDRGNRQSEIVPRPA